jgi:hypothetical protein
MSDAKIKDANRSATKEIEITNASRPLAESGRNGVS